MLDLPAACLRRPAAASFAHASAAQLCRSIGALDPPKISPISPPRPTAEQILDRLEHLKGYEIVSRQTSIFRSYRAPQLIFLGAPGVGKGSARLATNTCVHLCT
eukprot:Gregarina_sp_Pseudo_9__1366@NODE_1914_length_1256_cov_68_225144_g1775_i0_p2_GENE_NODE_1914_length_1256_cov_68_225144_g1775_i0NODE_1914_length_1256_cov_68_225144_g1775_i0_p2_ORF_typecomplete_len104_score13_87RuvB_N/PF05496_12/0_014p47_phox_C/PF08944_11/0_23_NODE_1914_length_1256_cov_68_225144_g1775_i07631074